MYMYVVYACTCIDYLKHNVWEVPLICQHNMHDLYILQVYHPNIDLEGNVCLNILRYGIKTCVCVTGVTHECWLNITCTVYMYIQ